MIDYDELTHLLIHDEAAVGASELHGLLTAAVCVAPKSTTWRGLLPPTDGNPALASAIDSLLAQTQAALDERAFDFTPLLPLEDAAMAERVEALAAWCRGFIDGLLAAGIADPMAMADEAGEFLRDLARIGEAEAPAAPSEEDEHALAELVEYVRAGVGHVHEECRRDRGATH